MKFFLSDSNECFEISENIFGKRFNSELIHQVVTSYLLVNRQGSKSQKSRSEVRGSGRKPWRQKGTGRARAGSIRSPIWRSGGVTFAAKNKKFCNKINKKMYRGALKSIFSKLFQQHRLIIVKNFIVENHKTKFLLEKLHVMKLTNVLIIIVKFDKNLFLSSRNLCNVLVRDVSSIDPVSLISFNNILMTVDSVKKLEKILI
ncbi:MAG: 50S ribosomal subunit protein L4 [Candidatus Westeberhardia cardiocondylae]|nr:50S ribosomal subunit protein L4 [Candidatus Westeberhardia cardiocondylae]